MLITPSAPKTRRVAVAVARGALDVVDSFHDVVDAKRQSRDQQDSDELEAAEDVTDCGNRNLEPKVRQR